MKVSWSPALCVCEDVRRPVSVSGTYVVPVEVSVEFVVGHDCVWPSQEEWVLQGNVIVGCVTEDCIRDEELYRQFVAVPAECGGMA